MKKDKVEPVLPTHEECCARVQEVILCKRPEEPAPPLPDPQTEEIRSDIATAAKSLVDTIDAEDEVLEEVTIHHPFLENDDAGNPIPHDLGETESEDDDDETL